MMKHNIISHLNSLEQEKNIKILLACETGSRAWGFPSPDSDFDIRMIYMHDVNWYLKLNESKDSIERMLDNNEIDISGWDLRKALRLLWKSNAALLEHIQSPIIYKEEPAFVDNINKLASACYSRIASMHHYLSLSKKFYFDIQKDERYKLKSFFYCLRSSVACLWILEHDVKPPIQFKEMLDGLNINESIIERVLALIELKAGKLESYRHEGEKPLFEFIKATIDSATKNAATLPGSNANMDELNTFFIDQLNK